MPPCLDVYALSAQRNMGMIDAFLNMYAEDDARSTGPINPLAIPTDFIGSESSEWRDDEWELLEFESAGRAVEFGVSRSNRAFRIYLPSRRPWMNAILAFTQDARIIFGVAVDDPFEGPDGLEFAQSTQRQLALLTNAAHSWIAFEEPPPLDPEIDRPWERQL